MGTNEKIRILEKRVERGMKFLDKNKPGWVEKINLKKLDLGDGTVCITGQAYKDHWDEYITSIKDNYDEAIKCGFYLNGDSGMNGDDPQGFDEDDYDLLTAVWFWKVTFRRECQPVKAIVKKALTKKA